MIIDPEKVAALVAEIAEEEITTRFGVLDPSEIDTKSGPNDLVTAADHAAEARLEKALKELYPAAGFIGEETAAANPLILDALEGDGAFWIVDPLDGTRNFVKGVEEFGSIVALVVNGEIRQGWIYAIPDKAFAIGEKGEGAYWRGVRLPENPAPNDPLVGYRAIGALPPAWRERVEKPLRTSFDTEPAACSAYAYVNIIQGARDFALSSRCSPWDHAAGIVMLREIGGRAEYLDDGAPYTPQSTFGRPMLVASGDEAWERVNAVFQPQT